MTTAIRNKWLIKPKNKNRSERTGIYTVSIGLQIYWLRVNLKDH